MASVDPNRLFLEDDVDDEEFLRNSRYDTFFSLFLFRAFHYVMSNFVFSFQFTEAHQRILSMQTTTNVNCMNNANEKLKIGP